jgi:hypothetical protein
MPPLPGERGRSRSGRRIPPSISRKSSRRLPGDGGRSPTRDSDAHLQAPPIHSAWPTLTGGQNCSIRPGVVWSARHTCRRSGEGRLVGDQRSCGGESRRRLSFRPV